MRILFITEDDPLYVIQLFERFFAERPEALEVVGMTISRPWDESRLATARRVLRFYGIVDFTRLLARYGATRLRRRSIGSLADRYSVPLIDTDSVNDPAYVERIRALRPDVVVSVAAPEIFQQDLLEAPRLGCLNIHSGRLPTYRGMMPTFWQMLLGEPSVTVTVHEMAARLDAGAVLGTVEVPIRPKDRLSRLMAEGKRQGAHLLIRVLGELEADTGRRQELAKGDAGYFSFPSPEDVCELRRQGHSLL